MKNLKIIIQYDGSNFSGWQIQPNVRTVQGEISKALFNIYGEKITIYGCGRTDSGVHALGQVANFKLPYLKMPINKVHYALNNHLPRDIRIISCEIMDDYFNARASAIFREYIYIISNSDVFSPFYDKYAWFYRKNIINEKLINEYSKELIGEHDFTSFCSSKDENDTKFRYIERAHCVRKKDILYFIIRGNAFLHNMVRIIVGTLIEGQKENMPYNFIRNILSEKDRRKAFITAPAHGLYFRRAFFK